MAQQRMRLRLEPLVGRGYLSESALFTVAISRTIQPTLEVHFHQFLLTRYLIAVVSRSESASCLPCVQSGTVSYNFLSTSLTKVRIAQASNLVLDLILTESKSVLPTSAIK